MDATVSLFNKHSFKRAVATDAVTAAATGVVGVGAGGSTKVQPYTKISLVIFSRASSSVFLLKGKVKHKS